MARYRRRFPYYIVGLIAALFACAIAEENVIAVSENIEARQLKGSQIVRTEQDINNGDGNLTTDPDGEGTGLAEDSDGHKDDQGSGEEAMGKEAEGADIQESANEASEPEKPLSSVYISTYKPGLGSHVTEAVFKENALVGAFNACRIAFSEANPSANTSECFVDDAYNDRITFEITYAIPGSSVANAFQNHPPRLDLLGESSAFAMSEIISSDVSVANSNAEITVLYSCKRDSDAAIFLKLDLQLSEGDDGAVSIVWSKLCASGANDKIDFGYIVEDQMKKATEHRIFGSDSDSALVVPPSDASTEVFAKLQIPGAQQGFLAPLVVNNNPEVVEVRVRGNHPSGGLLQGLQDTIFQVNYECLTKGESDIQVSVGIPPFTNLTGSWKKECGGQVATKLSVGSTEGGSDIVSLGAPSGKYRVDIGSIGTAHSEEHLHLPGNQSDWTIYLTYGAAEPEGVTSKDSALHMGRVIATVENSNTLTVLAPKVSNRASYGYREISNSENVLRSGDKFRITFPFVCRQLGESRVLVTIPLLQYDKLEFGIAKECTHVGTSHKSSQWVLTVGNVFWGFLIIFVGGFSLYYLRIRNKLPQRFEPVSTTEK